MFIQFTIFFLNLFVFRSLCVCAGNLGGVWVDMDTSILFVTFVLGFFLGRKSSNRRESYFCFLIKTSICTVRVNERVD